MDRQFSDAAARPFDGADAAATLRNVEAVEHRARLQGRLVPTWYGPTVAALLTAYSIGASLIDDADGFGMLSLWTALVAIVLTLVLVRFARRRSGVAASPSPARRWVAAAVAVGTFAAGEAMCRFTGLGTSTSLAVTGTALGLVLWGYFVWRNAAVRRELRNTP